MVLVWLAQALDQGRQGELNMQMVDPKTPQKCCFVAISEKIINMTFLAKITYFFVLISQF